MKKKNERASDEPRDDYSPELIRAGMRGKYAARYREGTNVVFLDSDVAAAFKNSESVNAALRLLMKLAQNAVPSAT